jgi:hypothetical protein
LIVADLAASVACGEPFLDRAVQPGLVILVPAEENLRDIWLRLEKRLAGDTDPPLFVLPVNRGEDDLLDLANIACLRALGEVITQVEPAILILDPFRELHGLAENDADAMGPLLRPLRQLAHGTDVSVMLTHHMSRAGNFRGSTAIRAAADQEWAFRRPDEPDFGSPELAGTLSIEGGFGPRQPLGIRLGEELRWHLSLQALGSAASSRTQVLDYLAATSQPATAHEIAAAIGAMPKSVQNVLAEVRRMGHVAIETCGTGRKNDPLRYRLEVAS